MHRRVPAKAIIATGLVLVVLALSACTLVSGWSDLQGGKPTVSRDAGGKDPTSSSSSSGSTSSSGNPDGVDAQGADTSTPDIYPPCTLESEESCTCRDTCTPSCNLGGCVFDVKTGAHAVTDCNTGSCTVQCESGAICVNSCNGGHCIFHCLAGSQCTNDCNGGDCTNDCAAGTGCN